MWLLRFWKPALGALVVIGAVWAVHHRGYAAGRSAERAIWQPQIVAAEKARVEADARATAQEAASQAITRDYEARHAEIVTVLNTRAADADRRIRALSVRLAEAGARRCEVPSVPGAAAVADDASAILERADRAGTGIADVGRRCESDATRLAELQRWVRDQRAVLSR